MFKIGWLANGCLHTKVPYLLPFMFLNTIKNLRHLMSGPYVAITVGRRARPKTLSVSLVVGA